MDITIERGVFDGLYSYEIALLAMGFMLFVFALWALVRTVRRGGSLAGPLALLPFVLVFVGYPSVQRIRFGNALEAAGELVSEPGSRPVSAEEHREAEQELALAADRAKTPQQLAVAAAAFTAIGEVDKAFVLAEKVGAQPQTPDVAGLLSAVYEAKSSLDEARALDRDLAIDSRLPRRLGSDGGERGDAG